MSPSLGWREGCWNLSQGDRRSGGLLSKKNIILDGNRDEKGCRWRW
jgi:hypothetical protein